MPPYRIEWLDEARTDVRGLDRPTRIGPQGSAHMDRPTAMRLFEGVLRFARTGSGDVNARHGDMAGAFRLRLGDYRVLFTLENNAMRIFGVRHRSQAYR
jgi:ParE toxin of type II toxin-antitoxin system, parDE